MQYIPHILHQTWKDSSIPDRYCIFSNNWKLYHSNWDYILWTDDMLRSFIRDNFSGFLSIYDSFEFNIQKVDVARYLILYKLGGVFVDLDYDCFKNIEPLLENKLCVFSEEPSSHCKENNRSRIITNAFMAAIPDHNFFKYLYVTFNEYTCFDTQSFNDILESTGPFFLTNMLENYDYKNIEIISYNLISPLSKKELYRYAKRPSKHHLAKIKVAFAMHYYDGSWWKNAKK